MVIGATKQAGERKESTQEVGGFCLNRVVRENLCDKMTLDLSDKRPDEDESTSHANILLSFYYVPDTVLGPGIITVNNSGKVI